MMDHIVQRPPLHLGERISRQRFRRGVRIDALLLLIHQEHGHAGVVEDRIEAAFAFAMGWSAALRPAISASSRSACSSRIAIS